MLQQAPQPLLEVRNVSQRYNKSGGEGHLVLDEVSMTLNENEIVGLLGRSGSGKSTLLRIVAGLNSPSDGEAIFNGKQIDGPAEGIAMVFQSFALFPWL